MESVRRESSSTRRQRDKERRLASDGLRALVWLYYDQHRDAREVDDGALVHLAGAGVAAGLSRAEVHVEVVGSERQINDGGGVRASDGNFHDVHTGDGWLGRVDLLVPQSGAGTTPCPDPRCPSWGSWRGRL